MLGARLLAAAHLGAHAGSLGDIAGRLSARAPYNATARYEVLLPQSEEPVVYDIALHSAPAAAADTLSPCDYLIDWSMDTPSGQSKGFNAYFGGHHYRFRDKRLQEYHHDDEPEPFAPGGRTEAGVQCQAQFASLLPAFVAAQLRDMLADSSYTCTVDDTPGRPTVSVRGVRSFGGCDALEFSYTFGRDDGLPMSASFCYNPGQMSEQTVDVRYGAPSVDAVQAPLSEPMLMAMYPEAFTRYRQSSYTLDNLPGRPLPAISAPTPGGGRYHRATGEAFGRPAVVAILDAEVEDCAGFVGELRRAIDASPGAAQLVMAFTSKHEDAIAGVTGTLRDDETVLTRASGLARDCGATATPVVLVCDSNGTVRYVHTGRNKNIASLVMQEIAITD